MKLFSRHYGTERFFFLIFGFFAIFIGMVIYSGVCKTRANHQTLSTTAVYTPNYTWSRTSDPGSVVGVFRSSDNTKVLVLLHNGTEDRANKSSVSAKDYTVFMTGRDEPLMNKPSLAIYSYGDTGYVGLYFTDVSGFKEQIVSLIVRNDTAASIVSDENDRAANIEQDVSFYDHNQIRIYVNLGAKGVDAVPCMDEEVFRPEAFYLDILKSENYGQLVNDMIGRLDVMQNELTDVALYEERLSQMGIAIPEKSDYIAYDSIETAIDYSNYNVMYGYELEPQYNEDGSPKKSEPQKYKVMTDQGEKEYLYRYLNTKYLYPGTCNLIWQNKDMSSGFIDQIIAGTDGKIKSYEEYRDISEAAKLENTDTVAEYLNILSQHSSWRTTAGDYINFDSPLQADLTKVNTINSYTELVRSYLAHKSEYLSCMDSILEMEYVNSSIRDVTTVNANAESFYMY